MATKVGGASTKVEDSDQGYWGASIDKVTSKQIQRWTSKGNTTRYGKSREDTEQSVYTSHRSGQLRGECIQ